jgi:hydrogenase expression/formation protein HypE
MDEQRIRLEHGSGGHLSRRLIEEIIYPRFKSGSYPRLTDAATVRLNGELVLTTDTYVVEPWRFPGADIGRLAVFGTCNDIAVCGAVPRYLTAGFVLEEGFLLADLETVLDSMAQAAEEADVSIVSGDTKVVPRGHGGGIYINTAGAGEKVYPHRLAPEELQTGDRVILSAPLGAHGIAVLAAREKLEVAASIHSDAAFLFPLCKEAFSFGRDLRFIRDITRGGAAAVLNEAVAGGSLGLELDETAVPVDENVRTVAGILGLNPLEVANEGVLLLICSGRSADMLCTQLRALQGGSAAAVVGTVTEEHPGRVVLQTEIGGRRILDFPRGLLLPRIC